MKLRAINANSGHWAKGEEFECHLDRHDGMAYIECQKGSRHYLLGRDSAYIQDPRDCPDFTIVEEKDERATS